MPVCKYCGKRNLDKKTCYQIVLQGRKTTSYFCTRDEYLKMKQELEYEVKAIDKLKMIYSGSLSVSPTYLFFNEIKKILSSYSYEILLDYLEENETYLSNVMQKKEFSSEWGKSKYLLAIVGNNIPDYAAKWKIKKENQVKTRVVTDIGIQEKDMQFSRKTKQKSFDEMLDDMEAEDE